MRTDLDNRLTHMANVRTITALWRYPVKSMMGEELDASAVTEQAPSPFPFRDPLAPE